MTRPTTLLDLAEPGWSQNRNLIMLYDACCHGKKRRPFVGAMDKLRALLNQSNPLLDDCVWVEKGPVGPGSRLTVRTGLPTVGFRS